MANNGKEIKITVYEKDRRTVVVDENGKIESVDPPLPGKKDKYDVAGLELVPCPYPYVGCYCICWYAGGNYYCQVVFCP